MALRNCSRRLGRACFSKLGWQAKVIWRIVFSGYVALDAVVARKEDLFRESLKKAATEHMTAIQNNPDRIKAFFKDPIVAYAA
uniref:Uncharacterized protein n=1 Tax=mine drainage metagenome TaxID=410659 RepID=E6QLC9_9ZZZZ